MLFNSFKYIFFLIFVVTAYYALPKKYQLPLLFVASCLFYLVYKPEYIFILFFLIIIDYVSALQIAKTKKERRVFFLILSIGLNLGILFFFKYTPFLTNLLSFAFHTNTIASESWFMLPLGLSFHTFQGMSYTIEVFKKRQKPVKSLGFYSLFIMFFPQLAAGPIERPQQLLPQFLKKHPFSNKNMVIGLRLILWGMVKKIVIADRLGTIVTQIYGQPHNYDGGFLFIATILFAFEIYCDFSGYSDIAIGSARLLGYTLVTNFSYPYLSQSVNDFWTRWHMSLYSWFRDYVYIPLGGNRAGRVRRYGNILTVFTLSGFWHGASFSYITWGLLNGILVCFTSGKFFFKDKTDKHISLLKKIYLTLLTFLLISFTWIFFRASNLFEAFYILRKIINAIGDFILIPVSRFSINPGDILSALFYNPLIQQIVIACFLALFLLLTEIYLATGRSVAMLSTPIRWGIYMLLLFSILMFADIAKHTFIYFAF